VSLATRRKALLLLLLFTAALALIGAALPLLELQPGLPPPVLDNGQIQIEVGENEPKTEYQINDFLFWVFMVLFAAGVILAVFRALMGGGWAELRRQMLRYGGFSLAVLALLAVLMFFFTSGRGMEVGEAEVLPTPPPPPTAPLGMPPTGLVWLVGAALAAGALALGVWVYRSRPAPSQAMLLLGQEAEKARQALLTGVSLREVILQCYRQMSSALQEDHGIQRQAYMTTGDFERLLAAEGFPAEPVHQLTRLFEAVRYSRWQPGLDDDQRAITCLDAIIAHSRGTLREAPLSEPEGARVGLKGDAQ